jgi:REP element-mobilizing transposase RayT
MGSSRTIWNKPLEGFRISRRKLPHWQEVGRLYFVTFRTAGFELPAVARDTVFQVCLGLHGTMIDLHGIVVMPDHVHLVLQSLPVKQDSGNQLQPAVYDLGRIAHAIKSFSAHEINRKLGRKGKLWQPERFDRIVRDEREYREKLQYMLNNPVKKGIVADPYAYSWLAFPEAPPR